MQIEPGSQKEWDRNKQNVISQRDKLQGKINDLNTTASKKGWSSSKLAGKIGDMQERVNSLNNSVNNLTTLENSSQTYSLSKVTNSNIGGVTFDKNSGNINIGFDGTTLNFVHETTHGGQFESGDIAFDINSGLSLAQDLYDEVDVYKAQYSYDPSTTGGKNLSTINAAWVKTISPPLYDRHGINPVSINSTTQDLLRAYPNDTNLKAGINNLNPTDRARELKFKLKEYPNVYYKK